MLAKDRDETYDLVPRPATVLVKLVLLIYPRAPKPPKVLVFVLSVEANPAREVPAKLLVREAVLI